MTLLFEHKSQEKSVFRLPQSVYLNDLAVEIARRGSQVGTGLNPITRQSLQTLFDQLSLYYECILEGQKTSLLEIQSAIFQKYISDLLKRNAEKEIFAGFEVQQKIRSLIIGRPETKICQLNFLNWICTEYYQKLGIDPKQILNESLVKPQVGFDLEKHYDPDKLNHIPQIIALAASNLFLSESQPSVHNNSKIIRFFTNAYIQKIKIDSYGLWSLSRGLVMHHFNNDTLNRKKLFSNLEMIKSAELFLEMILEQIEFSDQILDPAKLQKRISVCSDEMNKKGELPIEANQLLLAAFYQGEIQREKIPHITGLSKSSAEAVLLRCLTKKLLFSETTDGPIRLQFPIDVLDDYFPNLLKL